MDEKREKKKSCNTIDCGRQATRRYYELVCSRLSVYMLDIPVCDKHFEENMKKYGLEEKDVKNFDWIMSWEQYEKAVKETIAEKPELKEKLIILKKKDII